MAEAAIKLWYAHPPDEEDAETQQALIDTLSEEEQRRWKSFRFAPHRQEYLTAHALLRTALSHEQPIPPRAWCFAKNGYGKPHPDPECGLRFNLSHSPALVACLVTQAREVGLDVEPLERAETINEIAPTVFSAIEMSQLNQLSAQERLDRALSLWTLKESYIKARGFGLSLPLKKFSLVFGGGEGIRLQLDPGLGDDESRWRFSLLDLAGHRIALMVESKGSPDLQLREWRSPNLPAKVVNGYVEPNWFPMGHGLGRE